MPKIFLSVLSAVLCLTVVVSETSRADAPQTQVKAYIKKEARLFSGRPKVYVNGVEAKPGYFFGARYEISQLMQDNKIALELAEKHECYAKWAGIAFWTGLGAAVTYQLATPSENYRNENWWWIFGTGLVSSAFLNDISLGYLYTAINAYNGVSALQSAKLDMTVRPERDGASLALKLSF